jgi:hypothetical protein
MQSQFDTWLDKMGIDGNSVLVIGDIEQELKYAYTVAFTSMSKDVDNQDNSKRYTNISIWNIWIYGSKFRFG